MSDPSDPTTSAAAAPVSGADVRAYQSRARLASTAILILALGMANGSVADLALFRAAAAVRALPVEDAGQLAPGGDEEPAAEAHWRRWPVDHPFLFAGGELALAGLMVLLYLRSRRNLRWAAWGALGVAIPATAMSVLGLPLSGISLAVHVVLVVLVVRGLGAIPGAPQPAAASTARPGD